MKNQEVLDKMADIVLAYRPKDKQKKPRNRKKARIAEILRTIRAGGNLQFRWGSGTFATLFDAHGKHSSIDGRSYQAFCVRHQDSMQKTETGRNGDDLSNLVITWRSKNATP